MKNLYTVAFAVVALLSFQCAIAQNYTAIASGAASNPTTWDANGIPALLCNNCNITINAGVTVTLDADILLSGNSTVQIGTDASTAAGIIIPFSTNIPPAVQAPLPLSGYHRLDIVFGDPVLIKFVNANTFIDASGAGLYDGLFTYVLLGPPVNAYSAIKLMGTGSGPDAPAYPGPQGTLVTGPSTINGSGILPIILSKFEAALNGTNEADLSWTSIIEANSDHYSVERSADAIHWLAIGKVAAKGNSDVSVDYIFRDEKLAGGTHYYRLQMVDRDGKFKYSEVRAVTTLESTSFRVFPNPARDYINLSIASDASPELTVRLLSSSGQVLQERKLSHAGGTILSLPIQNYAKGSYMISISGSDGSHHMSKVLVTGF